MPDNIDFKRFFIRGFIFISLTVLLPIPSFAKDYSFSWTANDGQVEGYKLYYKKGGSAAPPFDGNEAYEGVSPINIAGLTSFTITGLEDNSTYHFALTAYSGADESDFSDIITVFPGDDQSVMWYWDNDWDGYGTPTISVESASQPSGYVIDNSDCEDNNGNIHPGATEICGDNIDQDCNGSDTVCEPDPR